MQIKVSVKTMETLDIVLFTLHCVYEHNVTLLLA